MCAYITCSDTLHIKSSCSSGNWTEIDGPKTPHDDNEPTAPYITGRELNLGKLPGRQWESNPEPSRQLRPMTIKAGVSSEAATMACESVTCEIINSIQLNCKPKTVMYIQMPAAHLRIFLVFIDQTNQQLSGNIKSRPIRPMIWGSYPVLMTVLGIYRIDNVPSDFFFNLWY